MKRIFTLILTLLLALLPTAALAADVVSYTADFYVADYAEVLSDEAEGLIVLNNDQLDKACGAQIVVVTVNSTDGAEIENYAYTLFNEWGIGDKAKNNGLLILLAVEDGNYWLMPGKGLQDYLTAGDLDEMAVEYLIPSAQQGNYEEGIRQLFSACFEKVSIAYRAGVTLDESLYYSWLQSGSTGADGSKYLASPVREPIATAEPVVQATDMPVSPVAPQPDVPPRSEGGFNIMPIIIIVIVLVIIFSAGRTVRVRPGRHHSVPPRRPAAPPPHRPPMGGPGGPGPRPPMGGPGPRPPMGGMGGRPVGGYSRPASPSRPMGGTRTGGGYSRPSSPRPMGGSRSGGGFGGGRSGGGGSTRGGGSGGSFRGGR